jgi:predicted transcriptional regulator
LRTGCTPTTEEPDRAIRHLVNLVRGHALLTGRNYVTIEDLPLIVKVVLSTAPIERVIIFDFLLANNGILTVNQITEYLNISEPTSRRTMTELKALGLVDKTTEPVVCSDGQIRNSLVIRLKDQFDWFLSEDFKTLREGFNPASEEEEAAMRETSEEAAEGKDSNSSNNDNDDNKTEAEAEAKSKAESGTGRGRPKADWNNVLEDKWPVKEKLPLEKEGEQQQPQEGNNGRDNDDDDNKITPLSRGEISFTTNYPIEDSSITDEYYSCYYCDNFKTNSKYDYETHVIMRHGHSPAYPNKAELEKLGLEAQGKSWET